MTKAMFAKLRIADQALNKAVLGSEATGLTTRKLLTTSYIQSMLLARKLETGQIIQPSPPVILQLLPAF